MVILIWEIGSIDTIKKTCMINKSGQIEKTRMLLEDTVTVIIRILWLYKDFFAQH